MWPTSLPLDLTACALDAGYCVTDRSGEIVLSWRAFPLKLGVFVSGWPDEYGPAPTLEAVHLDGQAAVWVGATTHAAQQLVVRASTGGCWVVQGPLAREQFLQIAAHIAASASVRRPRP